MAISAQYFNDFEKNYTKVVYQLLKEKLFVSFGLELTATKVRFLSNSNFPLVGKTFAFYNPTDDSLNINIEDPFFTRCTSEDMRIAKMIFILFHEAYHKTLMHTERKGARDHSIWNIAADYEVHNMLYLYDEVCIADKGNSLRLYFEKIKEMLAAWDNPKFEADPKNGEYGCMFSTKLLENIAEEIYQMIISSKKVKQTTYTMSLSQMMGNQKNSQMSPQSGANSNDSGDSEESQSGSNGDSEGDPQDGEKGEGNGNGSESAEGADGSDGASSGKGKSNQSNSKNENADGDGSSEKDVKDNGKSNKMGQSQGAQQTGKTSNPTTSGQASGSSSGPTVKVTETTYTLPDGRKHTTIDIQWPDANQLPKDMQKSKDQEKADKDNKELRKQLMEQNIRQAAERNKGNISQKCEMFLKKLFKIKIDWEKILKSSLQTILSKSDYFTWARPRTSMFALDMYLPDIVEDNQEYGTLIVARDESGSMSDEEVAKCGAIIADAKEHYKKIIVLKHDTEIQYEGEFEDLNDDVIKMLCTRATCGGTSHKAVFDYIADYNKKHRYEDDTISCVILMTDCCSDIQDTQSIVPSTIPMVYLVPEAGMSYTKGIRGKIIPIEM